MSWQASLNAPQAGFLISVVVALFLLGSAAPLCAQEHRPSIEYRLRGVGQERMADARQQFGSPASADSATIAEHVQRMTQWYRRGGFLRVAVDSVATLSGEHGDTVIVGITEGPRSIIRSVTILEDTLMDLPATALADRLSGRGFSDEILEHEIEAWLVILESSGYPMASISVENLMFVPYVSTDSVDVVLRLAAGADAAIREIDVEGNSVTRSEVIVRESRLAQGIRYTPQIADRIRRRLVRLGLFSEVSEPELFFDRTGRAGLLIRVREGSPNRFDGILGYVPSSATGGGGYLTGLLNVQLRNLFGTARQFEARWYRETQSTQEVSLRYREPWLFGIPLAAAGALSQRQQDSTFVRLQAGIDLDVAVDDRWSAGATLDRTAVFPSQGFGVRTVPRSTVVDIGGRLRFDNRDDIVTPTSGYLYETSYKLGTKSLTFPGGRIERITTQTATMDIAGYISAGQRHVVAATIHLRDKRTPTLDLSDLERFGGASTLRGYREGQFLATRLIWGGIEYRLLAGQRSFLYAFLDGASLSIPGGRELELPEEAVTKYGYGIGIRVDSPVGLIGVSVALGEGDTFGTAKLHIRLVNEF